MDASNSKTFRPALQKIYVGNVGDDTPKHFRFERNQLIDIHQRLLSPVTAALTVDYNHESSPMAFLMGYAR